MPKQDRALRTPAIILRRQNWGEADRLLTILTPAYGKFDVIAYGTRKPASRKTGHVELFMLVDMLINHHRDPGTVTQAEMIEPFLAVREDMLLGAYASYTAELVDRFTERNDQDTAPAVFDLLKNVLVHLCSQPDQKLALRHFELQFLGVVGFRPELQYCVVTGEPVRPQAQFFSFADGGVVSPEGAASRPPLPSLSYHALKLLRYLQRTPDYAKVGTLQLRDGLHIEVEALILGYLTYTLEQQLQSVEFIRRLRRMNKT
jgi:DNA repair protein RecO (recombination protein O)